MSFPRFFRVRQSLRSHALPSVRQTLLEQLLHHPASNSIAAGDRVAIAVGSRGIGGLPEVVTTVVQWLKSLHAEPFLVPAMGSHGSANAAGQRDVLQRLGIDENRMGCQILSSTETIVLGTFAGGRPIHFDATAAAADHVIPINRVKLHTRLIGPIQSGLCKMLMVGLGNHKGAKTYHPIFREVDYRFEALAAQVIPQILAKAPIRFGIALVEDAFEQLGCAEVVNALAIPARDEALLDLSRQWMARLPIQCAELLIVDQIGKEISGTGMDTNIVGRKWHDKLAGETEWPKIDEIYVRSLSPPSAGNANGIGIAEYTTRSVADAMDPIKTRINSITASHPTSGALPVWFENDVEALQAILQQRPGNLKEKPWIRIQDTLRLSEIECSEVFFDAMKSNSDLTILSEPAELVFDANDNLASLRGQQQ